jgi:transposase-like protein
VHSRSGDFLRQLVMTTLERIMDSDVPALCLAGAGERSPLRENRRNGYRERDWETRLGTMALKTPKLRQGSYLPDFLDLCRVVNQTSGL